MQTMRRSSSKKAVAAGTRVDEQPRKLSKAGQWMRDHPNGIAIIVDRRAVNK